MDRRGQSRGGIAFEGKPCRRPARGAGALRGLGQIHLFNLGCHRGHPQNKLGKLLGADGEVLLDPTPQQPNDTAYDEDIRVLGEPRVFRRRLHRVLFQHRLDQPAAEGAVVRLEDEDAE